MIAIICRKRAVLILGWIVLLSLPAHPAAFSGAVTTEHHRLVLAENDGTPPKQEVLNPTPDRKSAQKSELNIKPETSGQENEKTPVAPFVPSEKIKADQAVDFPYDI